MSADKLFSVLAYLWAAICHWQKQYAARIYFLVFVFWFPAEVWSNIDLFVNETSETKFSKD